MTDTTAPAATYASLLDRIVETGGYVLPDGTDMWTIRTVHPDLRSSRDYRWPFPGQWATAPGPIFETNPGACPTIVGDGLCVATTWEGMASGGIPATTLLLCAINTADALSPVGEDKIRVRRAYVVDVIDGVTYRGIPFSQASAAEQIRVSLAMAMAANSKLRVIRILDGSLLDDENLAIIRSMATDGGYQIWIERVGEDDETAVIIEDGQVKQ